MSRQPNILFFLPDQHRPDWLGCNPNLSLRTPNLDRLAERGTRFTNAYTPSPLCSPARACLATGRDYERCGVADNSQNTPVEMPNVYRRLRDGGYEVVGVGKFDLHKPDLDWGLDGSNMLEAYGFTRGIDNEGKGDAIASYVDNEYQPRGPYMEFLRRRGLLDVHYGMYEPHRGNRGWLGFAAVTELPEDAYCDNWVAFNAMGYLRELPRGKRWFLVVNFVGPHGPFDVTPRMRERWRDAELPGPHDNDEGDPGAIREKRRNYAAMIENIDRHVGELIQAVDDRGELDDTLIVYASDHGEMLGDHGRWGKSIWYDASAGIPLIVAGPGVAAGRATDALVALHDLAATFLDVADLPALPETDARSLRGLLGGRSQTHRDVVTSSLGRWRMIYDGRHKLILEDGEPLGLFDLHADPREDRNIVDESPIIVESLRAAARPA